MVTFYAFISATNILRIPLSATENGTAYSFLQYFKAQNHITQAGFDAKTLSIRIVVPQNDEVSLFTLHSL
jgi:hypothetical protein